MPKVLIVNDVAIVNRILKKKLELEEGFFVDTVMTGKEGITKGQENIYDIILLDYHLPDINGDEVCLALKSNGKKPDVPIYFISAMDKGTMAEVIKKTGAQGHVDMAVDTTELAMTLKTLAGV